LIFEDHSTSAMVFRRDKFMEIGGWAVRHGGQADYFAWYRSAMDVPAIKEKAVTLGYRLQYDAGWMSELRRDVPGLLESLINTSKDLVEIKLLRNPEEPERLFLKRRISVYENVYSLINNLVKTRDSLIARDIQSLEGVLADETEHFKRLFMVDLEYFIDNLAVNQERLRLGYLLTLQKNSSVRSKNMNLIVSSLLDRIEPIIRNN